MKKKTVVITGSSRGIGKAIALRFAKEGWNVGINCSKSEKELEVTKREVQCFQADCLSFLGDVSSYDVCRELFQKVRERFGTVDVLVNNAGISHIGLFQDMKPEEWNRILQINLNSVMNCSHLVLPDMIAEKKGSIINISSVWGLAGASCEAVYSASKGGINAFTKALRKELGPSGVRVNAIACGAIDTEKNCFLDEEELRALVEEIPVNRLGTCEEVADMAYYLAVGNPYLTGQVISLDGGWICG